MRRRAFLGALATGVFGTALLAACTQSSGLPDSNSTDSADAAVSEYPASGTPVHFSGTLASGGTFDSKKWLGSVVVVNFWYANCPPCRAEAKDLESVYTARKRDGVTFIGVNVRDQAGQILPYQRQFGVTYPSIIDVTNGAVQLAFAKSTPANATPTTLVLDAKGVVRSRILGQIQAVSILDALIDTALGKSS